MDELRSLLEAFKEFAELDEDLLDDEAMKEIMNQLDQNFSPTLVNQSINQVVSNMEAQGITRAEARESINALKEVLKEMIYGEKQYEGNKKILMDTISERLFNIFDDAAERYHSYAITLPMMVDIAAGAKVPTYAHDTDAAADLYAMDNTVVAPHSYGNKIHTGVKIQLPEGWLAMILPRSSIGSKTPLRLSNSVGLIDSGYRGELGILYDNTSDEPYTINAGDRVAQLLVMPSYRFQAKVVDILADSDRGEGGFGASGK